MSPQVALLYDDSAYVESTQSNRASGGEQPHGLVGRQVAGRAFLDAYLQHGDCDQIRAAVWNQASADSLAAICRSHPRTANIAAQIVPVDEFSGATASLLHTPCPTDATFAWLRRERAPGSFSLCGVTHTLCTVAAVRALNDMLIAPFESFDALVCTSRSVVNMVRAVTNTYADYLGERFGTVPELRPRLAHIPLGVNPERFRPATPEERTARRSALNIHPDAVAVLFVGRFTPHAKAHPFPMLQGLARAARTTGRPVHLILSGWAANDAQMKMFLDGVAAFAPGMPVSVVNGMDPDWRFAVWHAADIVTSLADSIQETFGLVIVEAMASGQPVVATDWDGYRDLVDDGTTGLLVPTIMVKGATTDATLRLLLGSLDYDAFLADCNQAVAVDVEATARAYARLIEDADLRQRMGRAGRERVLERFTWQKVIRAYEQLWSEQETERRARTSFAQVQGTGLACYPAPELSFAGYPTHWLDDDARVIAAPGWAEELVRVLRLPLCIYGGRRVMKEVQLRELLAACSSPRRIGDLVDRKATIAWLLKYDLLRQA